MRSLTLALLICLTGCAAKKRVHAGVDYDVPVPAVSRIVLIGCDTQSPPKHCKKVLVTYTPGAEQIHAGEKCK